jgi:protein-S-isoprenylcysteine O-methyltransferase Ste14
MPQTQKIFTLRAIVQMVLVVLVFPLLPILISGQWGWWQAWAYAILSVLAFILSRVLAYRVHPDLIAERARFMDAKDTKPWDKVLAPLLAFGSVAIVAVAGVDRLLGWSPAFRLLDQMLALGVIVLGFVFSSWALIENRFFSGTVRIQTERGHQVISTGPYRIVRHPGYAGVMVSYACVPILLDSLWAFIPAIVLGVVVIVRTVLEDHTLQAELPGYREYAQRTRYRLIPGIW